jgi:hypothetical protein
MGNRHYLYIPYGRKTLKLLFPIYIAEQSIIRAHIQIKIIRTNYFYLILRLLICGTENNLIIFIWDET